VRPTDFLILFAIGAASGLIGDAGHVDAGVTFYLHDFPRIWNSQLWFPLAVGLGTASLGALRLRLGPAEGALDLRVAVGAVAAVLAIYAITSLVWDQTELAGATLCFALAVIVVCWLAESWADVACGLIAMVVGPLFEIAVVELEVTEYHADADNLLGVPFWLPALYLAAGTAAARIATMLAARHRTA
jgi:hypothetical protein